MMIYIIQGEEPLFIRNKLKEIENNSNGEPIKIDGLSKNFNYLDILDACNSNSLFSESSLVEVIDPPFLIKKTDENNIKELLDYCANPNYDTNLVFYTLDNNFNSKLKVYKTIAENAEVIKFNSLDYNNFNNYVISEIKRTKLNISNDAINELNSICKRSASLLAQNIEILSNYPEKITVEVIHKLCSSSDDNISFDFINALTNKDITKAVEIERIMFTGNDTISPVIGLIASQLRYLYELAYYYSIGKKQAEIIEITKSNEYRLKKSLPIANKLGTDKIMELLSKLSILDIKCKSDDSMKDQNRLELFIIELAR